jgi:hypothetical protein
MEDASVCMGDVRDVILGHQSQARQHSSATRSRKREFDATIAIELLAEAAVHRG